MCNQVVCNTLLHILAYQLSPGAPTAKVIPSPEIDTDVPALSSAESPVIVNPCCSQDRVGLNQSKVVGEKVLGDINVGIIQDAVGLEVMGLRMETWWG